MFDVLHAPLVFQRVMQEARSHGRRIALVPTMGALHEGHLALVDLARKLADTVAVSIFVNPTQFGPHEDLARYPRDLESDVKQVQGRGADLVFAPEPESMYPHGEETRVRVGPLAAPLCGAFRPGHFEGVATVVGKLFALSGPCTAIFGRKDYQQLLIVKRMAQDLFFPVTIAAHPIVREQDGMAMSSRNRYLSAEDRQRAVGVPRSLHLAHEAFQRGERRPQVLAALCQSELERTTDRIDYAELVDPDRLTPLLSCDFERALLAVAAHVGMTRLIDNVILGEDPAPLARLM